MTKFRASHGNKLESFKVDATAGASFTSSKGIKYTIPAGAFVTSGGAAVTGSVTVAVKEITSPGDMIMGYKPTLTTDRRMLVSYAELFVKATHHNQDPLSKQYIAARF